MEMSLNFHITRRSRVAFLVIVFFCWAGWAFRVQWLTGLARIWVVSEAPAPADAIVVLGGNLQSRPFAAASLYVKGYAPVVVVARNAKNRTDGLGITVDDTTAAVKTLIHEGVPAAAIRVTERAVFSTWDEAESLGAMAKAEGWQALLVPTDPLHTRRTRWIFRRTFEGTGCAPRISAIENAEIGVTNWWWTEGGLLTFQNEVFKGLYYLAKGAKPLAAK